MPNIVTVDPPAARATGRSHRLTEENFIDLANAIREGKWTSDGEPADSKSCAYQRAQSAVKGLTDRFAEEFMIQVDGELLPNIKTHAEPVDPSKTDKSDPHNWAIGPFPPGEKPRKRRRSNNEEAASA